MKIVILIPVFNDFKSASKLIEEIDINISELKAAFSAIVVNDASTEEKILETKNLNNTFNYSCVNPNSPPFHLTPELRWKIKQFLILVPFLILFRII